MQQPENSFLSPEELANLPFKKLGHNVLISRKASFYGINQISIGNHVRIDDFCILSGDISIGNNIHVSAQCALYGANGIELGDYCGLSSGCKVFSITDDFSGDFLVGPMAPLKFRNIIGGKVFISKFVQIGAGSIVLPDLRIGDGVAIGALSLVNKSLSAWGIYAGIPVKFIRKRNKELIVLANKF